MGQFPVTGYMICLYRLPLQGNIWLFPCILIVLVNDSIAGYTSGVDVYAIAIFVECEKLLFWFLD